MKIQIAAIVLRAAISATAYGLSLSTVCPQFLRGFLDSRRDWRYRGTPYSWNKRTNGGGNSILRWRWRGWKGAIEDQP